MRDVRRAGESAHRWLLSLVEPGEVQTQLPTLLNILIGCWICEKGLSADPGSRGSRATADSVLASLNFRSQEGEQFLALLNCDAASVLLSAGILRAREKKTEVLDRFVRLVASTMSEHVTPSDLRDTGLFATRFLLSRLQLGPVPARRTISECTYLRDPRLIHADASTIRNVADGIAEYTNFGETLSDPNPIVIADIRMALRVLMIYYLRNYNLEMGCLIQRAINYLTPTVVDCDIEAIRFILLQQQPNGCFGFLAPEIYRMRATECITNDIDIYLLTTISCLWSIAETTQKEFKLFTSV